MKALTNGLGVSEAADGVRAFVREYERHAFVGRRDELKQLDEWIAGEASTLLVVAPAGRGKSALLLHWAPRHPQIAWVPISVRYGTARSSVVRALLASRIAFLGGEQPGDWLDAARSSDVVVVLDGLDEAADGAIVDDLRGLADSEGVRIVVAARELVHRDAAGWARHLGWDDRALHIAPLNRAAIAELLGEQPVDVLNEVVRLSDGDPLTATLLAEHLAAGGELAMKEIEGGFDAVFEAWWQDMRSPALDAVVQTLARAASPVRPSLLARVADAPVETVADALEVVRRVVVTNAVGEVAFAHPRLGSYFTDRMSPDRAAEVDAAWAAATTTYVDQLANGKGLGSDAGYVLSCHCVHLERTGAPLEQYARLARRDWLEAWEAFEGGTTGFLEDMFSVWEIAERALAKEWSDAVTALQMKLSAACTLLTTTERNVSPRTRAEAVRLGVRSQRAAIASVVTIEDPYSLKVAVEALIEVLDDWGRQLLLATMDDPGRWPATAGAQLALEQELGDEAVQRLVAGDRPETRIERIVSAFDQHRAHAEALREVVRADLERLDYQEDPESALESAAAAVSIFDVEEGRTILGRAVERLDAIGDRDLYWDDHYGDTDPRFALSEAALKVNDRDLARAMLERARELPYPWSPETGPGPELVEAWSKYGPVPAEALDGLDEAQLVRAHLALLKGGLDYDRQLVVRALKVTDDATALRAAVASSDSSLQRLGAERLFEMLDACARKPDDYARGYPLYAGGMAGLAEAAELLKPKQIERAVKILWRFARNPPSPVSTWHVLHALVPALLRTSARLRDEIAQALLEYASENPRLEPPLCDVPGWEQLYDARAQASYVRGLLAHRDLDRADECIEALATLAGETMSEKVFATAIAVAKQFALGSLGVIARVAANEWEEIAELTTDAFEREEIGPWDVAAVVEQAPAPEQKAKLAEGYGQPASRISRAWAAPAICSKRWTRRRPSTSRTGWWRREGSSPFSSGSSRRKRGGGFSRRRGRRSRRRESWSSRPCTVRPGAARRMPRSMGSSMRFEHGSTITSQMHPMSLPSNSRRRRRGRCSNGSPCSLAATTWIDGARRCRRELLLTSGRCGTTAMKSSAGQTMPIGRGVEAMRSTGCELFSRARRPPRISGLPSSKIQTPAATPGCWS